MMKVLQTIFLGSILSAVTLQAQIKETPATIALNAGGNPQGFVRNSSPTAILFASTQGGATRAVPFTDIRGNGLDKLIRLEDRGEVLANGRAAFALGSYIEAAAEFGKVADSYGLILNIPQNFASEARFYQIESLRRQGQFKAMAPLLATPAGLSINKVLSDRYKKNSEYHKLWAIYGQGDMAKLEEALKTYQDPVVGKDALLPTPNFKSAPQNELVQLAFLRGEVFDKKKEKEKALQDFTRVFTLTFANEPFLSKQAMGKTMVILSQDPDLKSENERKRKEPLEHLQSVAYFFSKRFPGTPIPPQFQKYVVRPDVEVLVAKKEEEKKEEPAPKDGKGAPKDDKGAKSKGKGKAKPKTTKGKGKGKGKGKAAPKGKK